MSGQTGLTGLAPASGAHHRRKIVGRGRGSGHGGSSTRGTKGQLARSGKGPRPGFEGGQMPLIRRIPKRGFNHARFRTATAVINVGDLAAEFPSGSDVTPVAMIEKGLIRPERRVKLLADGDVAHALTIHVHSASVSAREKVEKAGGRVELIAEVVGGSRAEAGEAPRA